MKAAKTIFLLFFIFLNLSMNWSNQRVGILTDDYGIVTKEDLDEEELDVEPALFPPEAFHPFEYWFCLSFDDYSIKCEDANAEFWVKSGKKKHRFWTRRNWDSEFCKDMVFQLGKILNEESIVCFNASFAGRDKSGIDWIIDRVKSKNGEWSWFDRTENF